MERTVQDGLERNAVRCRKRKARYQSDPAVISERNVKWDVSDKFNLGFDTRFFDGRLSAVFDFYYDINDNILNQFMASHREFPCMPVVRMLKKILAVLIHMAASCL